MLNFARRALRGAAVCAATSALVLGCATPALAKDTLALPVEFNDFNADNVLFEYSITGGLESGLENLGAGLGQGLVEPTLGANGNPVYTRTAVESAARAMAAELNGTWTPTAPVNGTAALYEALQADYRSDTSASSTFMANEGATAVTFGSGAWQPQDSGYTAGGESLYKGAGPAWKQDNDAALGFDHNTPLVRTYTPEELIPESENVRNTFADSHVGFTMWNDAANKAGLTVTLSCGSWSKSESIVADGPASFEGRIPSDVAGDRLTVTITPNEGASVSNPCRAAAVKLAASDLPLLDGAGGIINTGAWHELQMGLDTDGNRFYNQGWHAYNEDGDDYTYEGQYAIDGSVAWAKDGDGVVAHEVGSTITRTFDVAAGTAYYARAWNAAPGMKIALYAGEAAEGEPLATLDTSDYAAWWAEGPVFNMPAGQTKLTVALTSTVEDNKIAALQVVSLGSASKLGDYDATVAKYADGSKGLDDATTCMDYVYCVLNHLFDDEALSYKGLTLKTPVNGLYSSITLKRNDTTSDGYSFVADTFHSAQKSGVLEPGAGAPEDGFKDLKYDLAAGTIENVAPGTVDDRAGFFPLDGIEGGQTFDAQFEYYADAERADRVEAMGSHNYHYSMVSHSKFTYDASKNQYFTFEGDDDTYLFINNQLVIDLGGAHTAQEQTVSLEDASPEEGKTWAQYLGLVDGQTYSFDFFYMERHTDNSDFAVTTNIDLRDRSAADDPADPGENPGGSGETDDPNKGDKDNGGSGEANDPNETAKDNGGNAPKLAGKKGKGGALPQTGDASEGVLFAVAGAGAALLALGAIRKIRA